MLSVFIPAEELWDEHKEEFVRRAAVTLQLEHSLVSISKWEARWNKPFLSKAEKTYEETLDYIRCMTLTQNVPPDSYGRIPGEGFSQIQKYIDAPMTATTFSKDPPGSVNRETITSEIIYYWMIEFGIPFECQKWHLNRLLTLIKVCERKSRPQKKMGAQKLMARNRRLNAARRSMLHSRG